MSTITTKNLSAAQASMNKKNSNMFSVVNSIKRIYAVDQKQAFAIYRENIDKAQTMAESKNISLVEAFTRMHSAANIISAMENGKVHISWRNSKGNVEKGYASRQLDVYAVGRIAKRGRNAGKPCKEIRGSYKHKPGYVSFYDISHGFIRNVKENDVIDWKVVED